MKLAIAIIFLLTTLQTFAQTPPITDGLVGYWPFNGNVNDLSGNNNHGTLHGPSQTTDRFDNENNAYYFDGLNDYIDFPASIIDNLNQGAIAFWSNISSTGDHQMVWARNGVDVPNWMGLSIVKPNFASPIKSYFRSSNSSAISNDTYCAYDNQWHFVVCMWDTEEVSYWVDGVKVASDVPNGSNTGTGTGFWLGNAVSNREYWTKGKIDDLSIYDRVLTIEEINKLYTTRPIIEENCTWSCDGVNMIYNNGNVGIGTSTPDQKLTVKGKIHTEEVLIDLNIPVPDYVFDDEYPLQEIEDVEEYVNKNKHLPEIPSAGEIEKTGLGVGEMNMKLLKKIEELTLYLIKLNKENKELKKRIEKLELKK